MTGASGALGSLLCGELVRGDFDVVASSRAAGITMDVLDVDAVFSTVATIRPDAIVHLAAVTGAVCDEDPARAWAVNVDATRRLAAAAVEVGVDQFFFASSAAVYGDRGAGRYRESDALLGTSTYAQTKIAAEEEIKSTTQGTGTSACSFRIFNCWGPGFRSALPMRLAEKPKASPVRLAGLDDFVRDYVHARDVAEVVGQALVVLGNDGPDSVNVASGVGTSNRQLVTGLGLREGDDFVVVDGVRSRSVGDADLLKSWLGYEARRRPMRNQPDLFS
ncbi:NAD-dependent epimerase/dehydratase family protein [Frigoribacterium sp. ME-P-080]|uniref:NAD-dependent epimerase/dehydratase family protein n=1 Tax=Frigoribacterium sp. ME-P-080 TaxID=3040289 RepID=UPI00254B0C9C|nr:NAD-dependent epimerase/dehydratase family protein [Frigoribacterium sp. ME-P-080]